MATYSSICSRMTSKEKINTIQFFWEGVQKKLLSDDMSKKSPSTNRFCGNLMKK